MTKKEAIEKIRKMSLPQETMEILSVLAPELVESENERIRAFLYDFIKVCAWSEKQFPPKKRCLAYLEKQKEPTEELSIRLNGLMQEYVKSGKDEEEQEHRLKCYKLFWDALGDSEFFKQKEQKPILEVFGFKVGDAVRLKDGDGRKHIIKSFEEIKGIHGPNFYLVEFEDNSARDGIYPGEEYPNGYHTQMEKLEEERKPVEPSDDELQRHQDELHNFKVFAAKQAKEHHISFVHDFEWHNFCAELLSYFNEKQKPVEWSKEDEKHLEICLSIIMKYDDRPYPYYSEYAWLKSLKNRIQLQPKQEWSEEDEEALEMCLDVIPKKWKTKSGILLTKWLKDNIRLQPKQEWSEDWREEDIQTRFAFYTYKDDPSTLYLSNVFVEEASRNHGFGTRILRAAEKVAETLGATTISLKVKRDSPANDWYRKNGYGYVTFEGEYDWREKNLEYLKPKKEVEWSKEDEEIFNLTITHLLSYAYPNNPIYRKEAEKCVAWFKSLPERLNLPPKQEWSEEDGMITEHELKVLKLVAEKDGTCLMGLYNKLKSFCPQQIYQAAKHDLAIRFMNYLDDNRPIGKMCLSNKECEDIYKAFEENDCAKIIRYADKYSPHWKPSEGQMRALQVVVDDHWDVDGDALYSLYTDLKKLI